ncbi:Alpha/Beta hydrolase protein [Crucibulum laeve]|uniref:Alpha/Beta hydrolase protein n=1 Tax=Crucibulum laeve TaxID=68775 RepID=A0A5C3LX95_9AGAR|nr:Alpha/Beta hydrolase protein [Crucibulum laeve]
MQRMGPSNRRIALKVLRHGQSTLVYPGGFGLSKGVSDPIKNPSTLGLPYEDIELRPSNKVVLRGYFPSPRATVIIFHGNAMNHGDVLDIAKRFFELGCNVFTVSYRGFGNSSGTPSEKGLRIDGQAAVDFVFNELPQIPIIIFGQSLGGAVGIDVTSRNPSKIKALIVENTFTSIPDVVRDWPFIGNFWFLCTHKWNSAAKIPLIPTTLPILMLSGDLDKVVPKKHTQKLWTIAFNRGMDVKKRDIETKKNANNIPPYAPPVRDFIKFLHGKHHNTYRQPGYWETVSDFLVSLENPPRDWTTKHNYRRFTCNW